MRLRWTPHSRKRLRERFGLHPRQINTSHLVLRISPKRCKKSWRDPVAIYYCRKYRFYLRINTLTWEVMTVYV